jgi:hypothetical protein
MRKLLRLEALSVKVLELKPVLAEQTRAVAARVVGNPAMMTGSCAHMENRLRLVHMAAPVAPLEALAVLGSLSGMRYTLTKEPEQLKCSLGAIIGSVEGGRAKVMDILQETLKIGQSYSASSVFQDLHEVMKAAPELPGFKEQVADSLIQRFLARADKKPEAFLELYASLCREGLGDRASGLVEQVLPLVLVEPFAGFSAGFFLGLNATISGLPNYHPADTRGSWDFDRRYYGRWGYPTPPAPATAPGKPYELPKSCLNLNRLLKQGLTVIQPTLQVSIGSIQNLLPGHDVTLALVLSQINLGYIASTMWVGQKVGLPAAELGSLLFPLRALHPLRDDLLGRLCYIGNGVPAAKGLVEYQHMVVDAVRRAEAIPEPTLNHAINVQVQTSVATLAPK